MKKHRYTITATRIEAVQYQADVYAGSEEEARSLFDICSAHRTDTPIERVWVNSVTPSKLDSVPPVTATLLCQHVDTLTGSDVFDHEFDFDCTAALEEHIPSQIPTSFEDVNAFAEAHLFDEKDREWVDDSEIVELFVNEYLPYNLDEAMHFCDEVYLTAARIKLVNEWGGPYECYLAEDEWLAYRTWKLEQLGFTIDSDTATYGEYKTELR